MLSWELGDSALLSCLKFSLVNLDALATDQCKIGDVLGRDTSLSCTNGILSGKGNVRVSGCACICFHRFAVPWPERLFQEPGTGGMTGVVMAQV